MAGPCQRPGTRRLNGKLSRNPASLAQPLLVHGVAGAALLVLAVTMRRVLQHRGAGPAAALAGGAGGAAAVVSFAQSALAAALFMHVRTGGSALGTKALFTGINLADTCELVLLGVFIMSATIASSLSGLQGGRLRFFGYTVAVLLPVGGLEFLFPAQVLNWALTLSLPLLLAWAAAAAVATARRGSVSWGLAPGPSGRQA